MGRRKAHPYRAARKQSVCPECHLPIQVGDPITRTAGDRWVHAGHVLRRRVPALAWEGPRP